MTALMVAHGAGQLPGAGPGPSAQPNELAGPSPLIQASAWHILSGEEGGPSWGRVERVRRGARRGKGAGGEGEV